MIYFVLLIISLFLAFLTRYISAQLPIYLERSWRNLLAEETGQSIPYPQPELGLLRFENVATRAFLGIMILLYLGFIGLFWLYGLSFKWGASCILLVLLVLLADIDRLSKLLPDCITLPGVWVGLLINTFGGLTSLEFAVLGAVTGYGMYAVAGLVLKLLTQRDGMGQGDVKLMALIGAWLGLPLIPFVLTASMLLGIIGHGIALRVRGKRPDAALPYGPAIALAAVLAMFLRSYVSID